MSGRHGFSNWPLIDRARPQVRDAVVEAKGRRPFVRIYFTSRVLYVMDNRNIPFNVNRLRKYGNQSDLFVFGSSTGPFGYIYEG